jgi:hypothetical protein
VNVWKLDWFHCYHCSAFHSMMFLTLPLDLYNHYWSTTHTCVEQFSHHHAYVPLSTSIYILSWIIYITFLLSRSHAQYCGMLSNDNNETSLIFTHSLWLQFYSEVKWLTIILSLDINYDDKFLPLLRRFNLAEPVVNKITMHTFPCPPVFTSLAELYTLHFCFRDLMHNIYIYSCKCRCSLLTASK